MQFPLITKIEIENFSLFKKKKHIVIDVICLAGANGLGKSTFISIINYGFTWIVKNPNRDFSWYNSIPQFYSKSKNFASEYFDGRITEEDRDLAEITLYFTIGKNFYKIKRSLFEKKVADNIIEFPADITSIELNEIYKKYLTEDIELSIFEQFVFLQFFVFSFDETYKMLFWDHRIMEPVLYLLFGIDPKKAEKADSLRKEHSKFDSKARNLQYQITSARKEFNNIKSKIDDINEDSVSSDDNITLLENYKNLEKEISELISHLDLTEKKIKETELSISDSSLKPTVKFFQDSTFHRFFFYSTNVNCHFHRFFFHLRNVSCHSCDLFCCSINLIQCCQLKAIFSNYHCHIRTPAERLKRNINSRIFPPPTIAILCST
ncbi:MAG: AAA family ATPase [Ignavibacteria bacterium]|jgi:hypothetical protein